MECFDQHPWHFDIIGLIHLVSAGSPLPSRKNTFSMFETANVDPSSDSGSGRTSPIMMSPSSGSPTPNILSPSRRRVLPGNQVETQLVIIEDDDGVCVCVCVCATVHE